MRERVIVVVWLVGWSVGLSVYSGSRRSLHYSSQTGTNVKNMMI